MAAFVLIIILPLGYAAHWCVTSVPGLFQHAGWDVQPLDPVSLSEQYTVRYIYKNRHRAASGWARLMDARRTGLGLPGNRRYFCRRRGDDSPFHECL